MRVRRGDVVLTDFPFTDGSGSKIRPALVIQNDRNNQWLNDTILILITSRTSFALTEPTQLYVDVSTPDGAALGLLFNSAVKAEHILTIDHRFIQRVIGSFSSALMQEVNGRVIASLDLTH